MRTKKEASMKEVDTFWESMPPIQQATVTPFFYTRLQGKLLGTIHPKKGLSFQLWHLLNQPKLAVLVVAFFITIQAIMFVNLQYTENKVSKTHQATLESFAEAYNISFTSYNYIKK